MDQRLVRALDLFCGKCRKEPLFFPRRRGVLVFFSALVYWAVFTSFVAAAAQSSPVARTIRSYALTSANDFPQRDPTDWRLLGWNEGGKGWKIVDIKTNQVFQERHQRRVFKVTQPGAFTAYRLEILKTRDPGAADSMQISEIQPLGENESDLDPVPTWEDTVTAAGCNPPLETERHAFDGKVETKWLDYARTNPTTRASWIQWRYGPPGTLITNAQQILELRSRARQSYNFRIAATYAGRIAGGGHCFVDKTGDLDSPALAEAEKLRIGDEVVLSGSTSWNGTRAGIGACRIESLRERPSTAPIELTAASTLNEGSPFVPARVTGRVNFVAVGHGTVLLDLESAGGSLPVCVLHPGPQTAWNGSELLVEGLCEGVLNQDGTRVPGLVWVSGPESIQMLAGPVQTNVIATYVRNTPPQQPPGAVLTKIGQLRQMSPEQLVRWPRVSIQGIVTELFGACVQDGTGAVEVWYGNQPRGDMPAFGALVNIEGRADWAAGHGPILRADVVQTLGKGKLPEARRCSWSDLSGGRMANQWIELDAVVRATDGSHLLLSGEGGQLMATIRSASVPRVKRLIDASVRLRGIGVPASDSRGRPQGIQLLIPSMEFVDVERQAPEPFSQPRKAIGSLLQFQGPRETIHRVKVQGVLTFHEGRNYFVQDVTGGAMAIEQEDVTLGSRLGDWNWTFWQNPNSGSPGEGVSGVKAGDQVEVIGFPEMGAYAPVLVEVLVRKVNGTNSAEPVKATIPDILAGDLDSLRVTLDALVLRQDQSGPRTLIELQADQRVFQAVWPVEKARGARLAPGTLVRVTGVCQLEPLPYAGLGKSVGAFKLLMGSPDDLAILKSPPWWTLGRALVVAAGLLFSLALAVGWIRILRKQVEQRTRELRREVADHEKTEAQLASETRRVQAEIEERKRIEAEVEKSHKQLMIASRMAGMAEVATSVLHNVGNVLNSANVTASLIVEQVEKSKVSSVSRLASLLAQHRDDLPAFFKEDTRARQIPAYVESLGDHLKQEQGRILEKTRALTDSIQHIKEIVATQQNYARIAGSRETLPISEIVEDALRMHTGSFDRHGIELVRDFHPTAPVTVDRHKLLQILFNLLENARYACDGLRHGKKQVIVKIEQEGAMVRVSVIDNGIGIPSENLGKIFAQDFSTRKHGHGFGLHSSLLAAQDMRATLNAQSDGPGHGATFVLQIPVSHPRPVPAPASKQNNES